jgi:hypothetical protein
VHVFQEALCEVLGERPEWLRVFSYSQAPGTKRAELVVQLRRRPYWFPVSRAVYERFLKLARGVSRGAAVRYLREYIREHRGYRGVWRGHVLSNRYWVQNRIDEPSTTFYGASALSVPAPTPRRFAWQQQRNESMGEPTGIPPKAAQLAAEIAGRTGLDVSQVDRVVQMLDKGAALGAIASELGISVKHAEEVVRLMQHFGADAAIRDSLERAIDRVVRGGDALHEAQRLLRPRKAKTA